MCVLPCLFVQPCVSCVTAILLFVSYYLHPLFFIDHIHLWCCTFFIAVYLLIYLFILYTLFLLFLYYLFIPLYTYLLFSVVEPFTWVYLYEYILLKGAMKINLPCIWRLESRRRQLRRKSPPMTTDLLWTNGTLCPLLKDGLKGTIVHSHHGYQASILRYLQTDHCGLFKLIDRRYFSHFVF